MVGVAALTLVTYVGVLQGHATIARAEGGTVVALRNAPLVTGDTLTTLGSSMADVPLDANVSLRLDDDTSAQLLDLAAHHRDVRLTSGTIDVFARPNGDSPRIETPSIAVAPDAPGLFRVSVDRGVTSILARHGTLRIVTPNGVEVLEPGELVTVEGSASAPSLHYAAAPAPDAFDGFNQTRDAAKAGEESLDPYGTWVTLARYGRAWQPREFADWAPYHSGRWFWRKTLGWVWIARESWGWLPYHDGGWVDDAKLGWCWVPSAPRAAGWSPGNAAFFAVVADGRTQSIGWVPLAPAEPFHSRLDAYRNATAHGGLTLLSTSDFYSGDFARPAFPSLGQLPATVRMQAPRPPAR